MADKKMTKAAGEHCVCWVLARYDWAAAAHPGRLERTDPDWASPDQPASSS